MMRDPCPRRVQSLSVAALWMLQARMRVQVETGRALIFQDYCGVRKCTPSHLEALKKLGGVDGITDKKLLVRRSAREESLLNPLLVD